MPAMLPLPVARPTEAADPPAPGPPEKPPEEEQDDDFWEKVARRVGHAAHWVAKVPKVLAFIPSFLSFALFDGLIPLIGFTASLGGTVGMVGLGAAGLMEVSDGVRGRDGVKVLAGAGEVTRGLFVGTLTSRALGEALGRDLDFGGWSAPLAYTSGVLNVGSGVLKLARGRRNHDRKQLIEGMLEAGMGACSFVAAGGVARTPALVIQGALAGTKFLYTHQDQLKRWSHRVRRGASEAWRNFKDIFRDEQGKA